MFIMVLPTRSTAPRSSYGDLQHVVLASWRLAICTACGMAHGMEARHTSDPYAYGYTILYTVRGVGNASTRCRSSRQPTAAAAPKSHFTHRRHAPAHLPFVLRARLAAQGARASVQRGMWMVFAFEWVQLYSRHAHAHARGPRRGDTIFQLKIAVNEYQN